MNPQVEKILKLPTQQKIILFVVILLLEAAALGWFLCRPVFEEHKDLKTELSRLEDEVSEKEATVANLPQLQLEYEQLNRALAQALTELPNSQEIPSLLTNITNVGKGSGLDFLVFRPRPEAVKGFYADVPVDISVSGSFHSVANFFLAVSNLPRIVNITNVNFADVKDVNNRIVTKVNCLATTFRFLDQKEIENDSKKVK